MKNILDEAMEDAKLLKKTAIENAKNVLVEAIAPQIKQFVESQLGEDDMNIEVGGEPKEDEKDKEDIKVPELEKENMYEVEDKEEEKEEEEEVEESILPEAEDAEEKKEDEDEEDLEEVVEITKEDLKKAFAEAVNEELAEAKVTKGFGDAQDATLKVAGGKEEKGIADTKPGEHNWNDVEPSDAKDWTIKEAQYRKIISTLKEELEQYKKGYDLLKRELREASLFNGKLLYTNKTLSSGEFTNKQRLAIIEAFDRAQTLREVELTYKALSESLKIAGVVSENKKPLASKTAKSSKFMPSASTLIKESIDKDGQNDVEISRWLQCAGLVK